MCFCSKSLDASADDLTQMSVSEARALWGDNLSCVYTWSGVEYTSTLQYVGTCSMYGANILSNSVLTSSNLESYNVIMYKGSSVAGRFGWLRDVSISCSVYSDGYLRGGFMARVGAAGLDPVFDNNLISGAPDNVFAGYSALSCNIEASASLANYYNVVYSIIPDGGRHTFRSITYLAESGVNADRVYFDNIQVDYYSDIYFCIICPYYGGSISVSPPVTITSFSGSSALGSYDINITVDIDLSPVVSEISGVAGEVQRVKDEVTGIATDVSNIGSLLAVDASETAANMSLEPLGTLSSIDYDQILDDADAVMEDLPNALVGTASLWSMISALVDTNAIWLWLIPLCMFLCFLSVMLWRS